MKRSRRIFLAGLAACSVCTCVVAFASCQKNEVTCTFVTYDGAYETVTGSKGENVPFPTVTRDGYSFEGWYLSEDFIGSPVTSAAFDTDTTYYARWEKVYPITLELEGGSIAGLESATLALKEGANVSSYMANYVPVKSGFEFGGWYIGEDALSPNYAMTTSGVTLTAKYKAGYTVNVFLQNEDLETYSESTELRQTGYALIGEEFAPEVTVKGYDLAEGGDALIIEEDKAKNVFNLYFDRGEFSLVLSANYPDGTVDVRAQTHVFGETVTLPQNPFSYENARFLGWATSADAGYDELLEGTAVTISDGDMVIYAIWNQGYVDQFSGEDVIYLAYGEDYDAVICRGGVDIPGTYDTARKLYRFRSATDTSFSVTVRLNEVTRSFVYYGNRMGTYQQYDNNGVNADARIVFDDWDGITWYYKEDNTNVVRHGTYSITDDGYYEVTFEIEDKFTEEESFVFLLGVTTDGTRIFRIRGEEANYGQLPMRGIYYPLIELDGFRYATFTQSPTTEPSTFQYVLNGDILTMSSASQRYTFRLLTYDGVLGYDLYTAQLDDVFTGEDGATLTLNGCEAATYVKDGATISGTYTYMASAFGDFLITVTANDATYVYLVDVAEQGAPASFRSVNANYAEYFFVNDEGQLSELPILLNNGDGTASLYEMDDSKNLKAVSSGSLVETENGYFRYTVTGEVADWAETKATTILFNVDKNAASSSGIYVYYWLSSGEGDAAPEDHTTVYTSTDGSLLTLVSAFAIYRAADGTVYSGLANVYPSYIRLTSGRNYYYFTVSEDGDNKTFERLTDAPLVLTLRRNNSTVRTTTLTLTRRDLGDGKQEAVYADTASGGSGVVHGYFTTEAIQALNVNTELHTFVSDDGTLTFKFAIVTTTSVLGTSYNFNYFSANETVYIVAYTAIDEGEQEVADSAIILTDGKNGNSRVLIYRNGETQIQGTFTEETVYAFDEYEATVYTFTEISGSTTFRFTLNNAYFRMCAENETYRAEEGEGTLTLDGTTHRVRYESGSGRIDGMYIVGTSILDENEKSISMLINDEVRYFDLNSTNKTYSLRGQEAGRYLKIYNGLPDTNVLVALDGHNGAEIITLNGEESTSVKGTYTVQNGTYTVTYAGGSYTGQLGSFEYNGNSYNAFYLQQPEIAGTYLDQADLSVLKLDSVGGAVKYDSYGNPINGNYVQLTEDIFYFESSNQSDAGMYTVSSDRTKVEEADFHATYYADDFASIVFYVNGIVRFNNAQSAYYTYDKATGKIFTYTASNDDNAKFGFLATELNVTDDTIRYTDATTDKERTYSKFDGLYVTFTDEAGNKLEFQPTGEATFTVTGTYTANGSDTKTSYVVVVGYDEAGEVRTFLANTATKNILGSSNAYQVLQNYNLELHFDNKRFTADFEEYTYLLAAYDYNYIDIVATYGSAVASMLGGRYYGELRLMGNVKDGETEFTLSGRFNYITDDEAQPVSFENGVVSQAGYYNEYYGHLYTAEFTGSDEETYHLSFFVTLDTRTNNYMFLIYSCTRTTASITLEDGSVVTNEEFVYTTGFEFIKGVDEETGENILYAPGDMFYPALTYKGVPVCSIDFSAYQEGDNYAWIFATREYNGAAYEDCYYFFDFLVDDKDQITQGVVTKRVNDQYETDPVGSAAFVVRDAEGDKAVYEIYQLSVGGNRLNVTDCVKNEDGSFSVTTEGDRTFTVSFVEDAEGNRSAVIVETTGEETPDVPDQAETGEN